MVGHHLILVQLSLGAVITHPMHQLSAAKGGVVGMNAICSIALIVPFMQQLMMLCCFKCWLRCCPSKRFATATRTSAVDLHTARDLSLPLVAAFWALPLNSDLSASKRLLRCLGVLVMIPISCLSRCLGSKRAVLTYCPSYTIWAFAASGAPIHRCLPDMRAPRWTVEA